jgi:outer membrane protein OmpA-like peptidoglycan-associated protein
MADSNDALDRIGTALHAADRDAVMSCFAADATLGVMSAGDPITFTGAGIGDAIDQLLTGFDALKLTPVTRHLSQAGVVEESVVSGNHAGIFAEAEPTNRRVFVNVRLTATWGPDSTLGSLWVEADNRALLAQIAGNDDVIGESGGLIATVRERQGAALRITDETIAAPTRASAKKPAIPSRSRRLPIVALAAVAVLLVAGLARLVGTAGTPEALTPLPPASSLPAATQSTTVPAPKPSPVAQPARTARPIIATAAPKAVPHVQRGKQVLLKSDVLFALNSAALTPAATAALTRLARQIRGTVTTGTIQVNGYTDNLGIVSYDIALSRSRALAVARVLQKALVGRAVTLVPQGFGQANPIAPNTSDAGRTRNRRVTIVLPVPR